MKHFYKKLFLTAFVLLLFNKVFSQDFTHDYLNPSCPDVTVNFQYIGNYPDAFIYFWDFGDGNSDYSGLNTNVSNTYTNSGTYSVFLYILDINYNLISSTSSDIVILGDVNWIETSTVFADVNENIQFSFNGDGNISSALWDFGDGNQSSDMSPIHSYSSVGVYDVSATIQSTCGEDIINTTVYISNYDFTYTTTDSCANSLYSFQSNIADTNGLMFFWDFGDGGTSNSANPSYYYSIPGDYVVNFTVSDLNWNILGGDTDTVHVNGDIYNIVSNPMSSTPNSPIVFSLVGNQTPSSVIWDFGDGNTSTDLSPTYSYSSTGQFTVTATVPTSCGDITYSYYIYISNIDFTFTMSSTCSPSTVNFQYTGTEPGVTQLYWEFDDGQSSCCDQFSPSHEYTVGSTYNVTLWAYDDNYNSLGMTVKPITIGNGYSYEIYHSACNSYTWNGTTYTTSGIYTYNGQTQQMCDSIVTLNLTINDFIGNDIYINACQSYTWAENGNTYTQSGVYSVTYPSSQGCDSIIYLNLTIGQPSSSSISETVCGSYYWNLTNQLYTSNGDYTAVIPSSLGCDSTITLHLTILEPYQSTEDVTTCNFYIWPLNGQFILNSGTYIDTVPSQNGCDSIVTLNLTIGYSNLGNDTQSTCDTYTWSANGQTYFESGTYFATIPNVSGCDSVVTLNLTVVAIDNTVSVNGLTISANEANAEYQWIDCGNGNTPIVGAIQASYTATQNGLYAVRITKNSCVETSDCVSISTIGITENTNENIDIYPNPFSDYIYLKGNYNNMNYSVFEANGKIIVNNNEIIDGKINTTNLEKGIYIIELNNNIINKRMIVVKN